MSRSSPPKTAHSRRPAGLVAFRPGSSLSSSDSPQRPRTAASQGMDASGGKELVAAYVTGTANPGPLHGEPLPEPQPQRAVPSKEVATKLAAGIVESRLAACVNIIPGVESVYWWDGKVNTDSELLLMIKTRGELLEQLTTWVS